jgi:hypothetical protein
MPLVTEGPQELMLWRVTAVNVTPILVLIVAATEELPS